MKKQMFVLKPSFLLSTMIVSSSLSLVLGRIPPSTQCQIQVTNGSQIVATPVINSSLSFVLRQLFGLTSTASAIALALTSGAVSTSAKTKRSLSNLQAIAELEESTRESVTFDNNIFDSKDINAIADPVPSLSVEQRSIQQPVEQSFEQPLPLVEPLSPKCEDLGIQSKKRIKEDLVSVFGPLLYDLVLLNTNLGICAPPGTTKTTTLNAYLLLKRLVFPSVQILVCSKKNDSYLGLSDLAWHFPEINKSLPAVSILGKTPVDICLSDTQFDTGSKTVDQFCHFIKNVQNIMDARLALDIEQRKNLTPLIVVADDYTGVAIEIQNVGKQTSRFITGAISTIMSQGREVQVFINLIIHSFNAGDLNMSAETRKNCMAMVALGAATTQERGRFGDQVVEGGFSGVFNAIARFASDYNPTCREKLQQTAEGLVPLSAKKSQAMMLVMSSGDQQCGLIPDQRPTLESISPAWSEAISVESLKLCNPQELIPTTDLINLVKGGLAALEEQEEQEESFREFNSDQDFRDCFPDIEPAIACQELIEFLDQNKMGEGIRKVLKCTKTSGNRSYTKVGIPAVIYLLVNYGDIENNQFVSRIVAKLKATYFGGCEGSNLTKVDGLSVIAN